MTTPDALRIAPYEVAPETFVIPWIFEAPPVGLISVNSMVIRGEQPIVDAYDMADDEFGEGQAVGGSIVSPWHTMLDEAKFHAHVDTIQGLPIEVVASCHAPAIRGDRVGQAFDAIRGLPTAEAWAPFTHQDLEMWLSMG